jgi:anion-transporting  ArsA/GET3 family ATPase
MAMPQDFSQIAQRRLLIVTGKGGAGKSVLSLAMAHRLAAMGRRVWLVELGRKRDREFTRLPELVGRSKIGHTPVEVQLPHSKEKIFVSVLDPAKSLAEYVDLKFPTGGFAGVLLNNRVTASFLEVVPGLPDLVQLGKLWYTLTRENKIDVIVLDAPSTGHALSLLKAPANFKKITRVGPIFRDASLMAEFLADPEQAGVVLAALPEEMAVQETLELQKLLGKDCPKAGIYVNKVFPELAKVKDEGSDTAPWLAYRYAAERATREHAAAAELKNAKLIPYFFPDGALPLFLKISELLN